MQYKSWVVPLLSLGFVGCSLLPDVASSEFSRQYSCPEERMTMKAVKVDPHDLFAVSPPPEDVAADPERLRVWKSTAWWDMEAYRNLTAIDVTGCGFHATYLCWEQQDGEELDYFCRGVDLDDPHPRFESFHLDAEGLQSVRERLDAAPNMRE